MKKPKRLRHLLSTILLAELGFLSGIIYFNTSGGDPGIGKKHALERNIESPFEEASSHRELPDRSYESKLREMIERHEGRRNFSYSDSRGNRTIGVGFNLERSDARETIEHLGYNFKRVYFGSEPLSEKDIDYLFKRDLQSAKNAAEDFAGRSWKYLSFPRRAVLVDMAYNLGRGKLFGFFNLRKALGRLDFERAAYEMIDSNWYGQVGVRSKELVRMMKCGKWD